MKKNRWLIVAVAMVAILAMLLGCAGEQEEEEEEEPITLTYHCSFGSSGLTIAEEWWMDKVEELTEGKVEFERIFGGALGGLADAPQGIKTRTFDIGQVCCVYSPGVLPASTVAQLPFLTSSVPAIAKASDEFFQDPVVKAEYDALNMKFLCNHMWAPIGLISKESITNLDQLAVTDTRAHGGAALVLAELGITTYPIDMSELAHAGETGVVDAAILGVISDVRDFGLHDVFPYWSNGNLVFYFFPMTFVINQDAWNSLPADIQQIMLDVNAMMPEKQYELYSGLQDEAWEDVHAEGMEKVVFEQASIDTLVDAAAPVWEDWVEDMNDLGLAGQDILDDFMDLISLYGG